MDVFVISMRGKPLMPCSHRKARLLLKAGKAKIYKYEPFTIQLKYATGETVQECRLGIDTGSEHVGISSTSEDRVLHKAEVELRQDIKSKLDTRREYRRGRRYRKTRYRKARFLNRRRKNGWLPPSLQARVDATFRWIDEFGGLLPNPELHIEVGKFDTAKMINPDIQGDDYQHGQTYGFYNNRYYVFARDNYTCQVCKKSKGKILQTHHIVYRSKGGTDQVDNLITVCTDCHTSANHQPGGILYKWMEQRKKVKQYKEPPFMNAIRRRIFSRYPDAIITYGSETTPRRKELGLPKTHYNDAIVISGIETIRKNDDEWLLIRQFRKKKRSLHEATARKGIKEPNRTQKRNSKNTPTAYGFALNDTVRVGKQVGFVSGFASSGCYVVDSDNKYVQLSGANSKRIPRSSIVLMHHSNNWQYIKKTG